MRVLAEKRDQKLDERDEIRIHVGWAWRSGCVLKHRTPQLKTILEKEDGQGRFGLHNVSNDWESKRMEFHTGLSHAQKETGKQAEDSLLHEMLFTGLIPK